MHLGKPPDEVPGTGRRYSLCLCSCRTDRGPIHAAESRWDLNSDDRVSFPDYAVLVRPERSACWGFVMHIIEYAVGGAAENSPEASALDALDRFPSYVDGKRAEGRAVYATSSEIPKLAFSHVAKSGDADSELNK